MTSPIEWPEQPVMLTDCRYHLQHGEEPDEEQIPIYLARLGTGCGIPREFLDRWHAVARAWGNSRTRENFKARAATERWRLGLLIARLDRIVETCTEDTTVEQAAMEAWFVTATDLTPYPVSAYDQDEPFAFDTWRTVGRYWWAYRAAGLTRDEAAAQPRDSAPSTEIRTLAALRGISLTGWLPD